MRPRRTDVDIYQGFHAAATWEPSRGMEWSQLDASSSEAADRQTDTHQRHMMMIISISIHCGLSVLLQKWTADITLRKFKKVKHKLEKT